MKQTRWISGAMSAGVMTALGVLSIDFQGLVTPAGLRTFCAEAPGWLPVCHSVLARFDRATVAVHADTFTETCDDPSIRRLLRPAAVLCKASDLHIFQQHARQVVGMGVVRVPFTDAETAAAWAQETASAVRLSLLVGLQARRVTSVPTS